MLIDDKELVEVVIFYRKVAKGYMAFHEKAFKDAEISADARLKYKKLTVKMKPLNWNLYNDLQERSYILDEVSGKRKFNYRISKESKLKMLIESWDAKTTNAAGEEVPIPINEATIMKLSPDIAESIVDGYDYASLLTEEEEGNS